MCVGLGSELVLVLSSGGTHRMTVRSFRTLCMEFYYDHGAAGRVCVGLPSLHKRISFADAPLYECRAGPLRADIDGVSVFLNL